MEDKFKDNFAGEPAVELTYTMEELTARIAFNTRKTNIIEQS
jgi:hypothetical protein